MIELNCSHEESKKILDLGYDFSKVCLEFRSVNIYGGETYIKVNDKCYIHKTSIVFSGDLNFNALEKLEPDYIPIIPKDALAKCLPEVIYSSIWCNLAEWRGHCLFYMEGLKPTVLLEPFNSAYEAFIWCHENYPEELKAKFDEVMG
jgi:hypothetical protein